MRGQLQQEYIQGSATCNDNYAWIAAVNMNANYYIAQGTRIMYNFSPQTYLDCSGNFKNAGCNGGLAVNCFQYSAMWGVGTTNDYPYFGVQRPCRVVAGYFKNKRAVEVPANKNGVLYTPEVTSCLNGITRATVLTLAEELGVPVVEKRITRDEVYISDEAFFTGTAAEVTPIREVDGRQIGIGSRGPVTEKLQKAYFDLVSGKSAGHAEWRTLVK